MIRAVTDSSVCEARPSPGTIRVATERRRSGDNDIGKIAAACSAIELCSRVSARPTGAASPERSVPNSTRPMTSIVSVHISTPISMVPPGAHCATRLRVASTIAGANDCTWRWLNTGCTSPRWRCQTAPSAVSRPSPRNAFSGRYVKLLHIPVLMADEDVLDVFGAVEQEETAIAAQRHSHRVPVFAPEHTVRRQWVAPHHAPSSAARSCPTVLAVPVRFGYRPTPHGSRSFPRCPGGTIATGIGLMPR